MKRTTDQRPILIATADINTAAAMVHMHDGELLLLRDGLLADDDLAELAAVLSR